MLDFDVQRFTRRCFATDQVLEAGQEYYSVLVAENGEVLRRDFSAAAWSGPPESAIGWWKSQVPDQQTAKVHWAPNDVMLHYFERLEDDPERSDMRYILALLMIRRRIVRLEESEKDDAGHESFVLFCPRNEREYRVPVQTPSTQRIEEIQNELARLLFGNEPPAEQNAGAGG